MLTPSHTFFEVFFRAFFVYRVKNILECTLWSSVLINLHTGKTHYLQRRAHGVT